uniref:Uncharacterized protein n=1 Tax=Anguilla anguilla TaxID=7936 RepID=A0A0E9WY42_ANGAN
MTNCEVTAYIHAQYNWSFTFSLTHTNCHHENICLQAKKKTNSILRTCRKPRDSIRGTSANVYNEEIVQGDA